jgi:hypothetical protein
MIVVYITHKISYIYIKFFVVVVEYDGVFVMALFFEKGGSKRERRWHRNTFGIDVFQHKADV